LIRRVVVAGLLVLCISCGSALAQLCWETVTPQNIIGFDFEIISQVSGPDPSGIYTYAYTVYRIDDGYARYKEICHISFWFPCGPNASGSILGKADGITMTCTEGGCPEVDMGDPPGIAEPMMAEECRFFWGFKLEECGVEGDYFLFPNMDEVSCPYDNADPYCTIRFKSHIRPELGKWIVKGGDPKGPLYDSGYAWVPTCAPVIPVESTTWGRIKVLYR